ncbi:MAG TPA: OmpA family protein [Vulgatibacter sp.]
MKSTETAPASKNLRGPEATEGRGHAGIAWLVALVVATGGITAVYSVRNELDTEQVAHAEARADLDTSRAEIEGLQARVDELEAERGRLAEEARQKAEALDAMRKAQDELEERLQAEVERGSVLISQQRGELVVDLIDRIVFDSGEAELNDEGKAVLRKVGETLARVPDRIIQVSGHTDTLRIAGKLAERFPTNWELSTTRATNVVRFLQDEVKIPGDTLVAAGLAEFRPIAGNGTKAGRAKNRRIEVRLLPKLEPRAAR